MQQKQFRTKQSILPQKTSKISNRQPNLTPKATTKRRGGIPKASKRKKIIRIRIEVMKNEENNKNQ